MVNKKGVEPISQVTSILLMIIILVILVGAVILFKVKGGAILGAIKDLLRFGK